MTLYFVSKRPEPIPINIVLPDNTPLRHAHCAFDTQSTAG